MQESFYKKTMKIAIPVALQAMLQSSFSMIDQIMVGQLGEKSIAAVEVGSKPGFVFTFVSGAVASVTGIMVSQYMGKKDDDKIDTSMSLNMCVMMVIALFTAALGFFIPRGISAAFINDNAVINESGRYLRIIALTYPLSGVASILAVHIRCRDYAKYPLYISGIAALINTLLNWLFIFGNLGMPKLGVTGAAVASLISQMFNLIAMIFIYKKVAGFRFRISLSRLEFRQYLVMLIPIVLNELLWTMGQNVNTFIYGHMGTEELAGMSLTGPVQGLVIGALSGIAQAAGILIGKRLGEKDYEKAYSESIRLCIYGFIGSIVLSLVCIALSSVYTGIFHVDNEVKRLGTGVMIAFAFLAPAKVQNMILGGGIIRSGGRTKYIMIIDILGTWLIGVPLGLLTGLKLKLPIVWVYFILSQEEVVRFIISIYMFRSRKWMNTIE